MRPFNARGIPINASRSVEVHAANLLDEAIAASDIEREVRKQGFIPQVEFCTGKFRVDDQSEPEP